ncbi:MAG TPA: RNA methyltransferase [Syntrophales bacterium]|nr:RNA methyltransferase [Syntrophales bacterium]
MRAARENITIVLNKPKHAGNVGAVARCAKNMGINKICLISGTHLSKEEIRMMATHMAKDVVDAIRYFDRVEEALAGFQYIVGATARTGASRGPVVTPGEMAERIVEISQNNSVALLFGSEDRGLTNDDLRFCHMLVNIPTSGFKSLNLSHAVMILCYEIMAAGCSPDAFTPRLATAVELEGMYDQISALLQKIGFLNRENPEYWMMHIRRFLSRTKLQAREVKIIRGICRQLDWYGKNLK